MKDFRRYAIGVSVFATVLYLALLIATFGQISLYTNLEVIPEADAGFVVGPAMSGVATLVVLASLLWIAIRVPEKRQRVAPLGALGVGAMTYVAYILFGGIVYALGRGDFFQLALFVSRRLASPFSAATGLLAFLVTMVYMLVLASRVGERGTPRWPWEKRGR